MTAHPNSFDSLTLLETPAGPVTCFKISRLADAGFGSIERMPFSIRILLENLLRNEDGSLVTRDDIARLASWSPMQSERKEVPFMPARVLLQDFTGVPSVVDLAAMRDAANRLYGMPEKINPRIPAELVIDHSVQVDAYGSSSAFERNEDMDYRRNGERYAFLRWGQGSFENFKVVPPATGICHQVNLEYLARVVFSAEDGGERLAYPDTVVGLDSHTTMINGIGVMGWGVGGIEAEAVMLGRPYYLLTPEVVGFRLTGHCRPGVTATDLVLTVTEILRKKGVVGKFVEFFGPGLSSLSLEDKATISNMSPEYGATMGFFPVDDKTLEYLRLTGRTDAVVGLVEAYCKAQGLFRTNDLPDPVFTDTVELDMSTVVPSLAGPKRPQDRVPLKHMKSAFEASFSEIKDFPQHPGNRESRWESEGGACPEEAPGADVTDPEVMAAAARQICHGSVVIAAITSCTNTSNPSVLIGAGLLAKKAVQKGLRIQPWVKTSLAPGSKVVIDYLQSAGLMPYFEKLNFHHVAYGCTTCIGNSGPLPKPIADVIEESDLVVASVLSGNRNFEGRINPLTKGNYLASPPLVVAYALAGTVLFDFESDALGMDADGHPVFLKDIWPSEEEIAALVKAHVKADMYREDYAVVFDGTDRWRALPVPKGSLYQWSNDSTYIKNPPFFEETGPGIPPLTDLAGARVLALLGNSVTTDHISPAGAIPLDSPAADYLRSQGVAEADFNSFGSRRGNHEVMMRGTFGNIRLSNQLVGGVSGGYTVLLPGDAQMSIYAAAMAYKQEGTPLVVLAGNEYGTGSSRDWAAKGTLLLGVKAVIAESFERIHRSNLVCMGVLPLEFKNGESHGSLGLTGRETYAISGIADIAPGKDLTVTATADGGGKVTTFAVKARLDSPVEVTYYTHGGILNFVLREMAGS